MLVIPAIDLSQGQVVRLERGDMTRRTVYSDHPEQVAQRWQAEGAERVHVVDLDGAIGGRPANLAALRAIVAAVDLAVDFGGGLRTLDDIAQVLDLGVRWAVLGTSALTSPDLLRAAVERFGEAICVSVDARDGRVAVAGWLQTSDVPALEFARTLQAMGVREIVHTDIARD